jgi:hypothetical protein
MKKYLVFVFCLLFGVSFVSCKSKEPSKASARALQPDSESGTKVLTSKNEVPEEGFIVKLGEILEIEEVKVDEDNCILTFKNATTNEIKKDVILKRESMQVVVVDNNSINQKVPVMFGKVKLLDSPIQYDLSCWIFENANVIYVGFVVIESGKEATEPFESRNQIHIKTVSDDYMYGFPLARRLRGVTHFQRKADCLKSIKIVDSSDSAYIFIGKQLRYFQENHI